MTEIPARVLLADDSMVVRAVIRGQLAPECHELIEAADGTQALADIRAHRPDAVLLDVEMPGMTGYEVLAAMQADPELAHIPVVFLSGRVTADDVAKGLKLGAHDYLRKPVEPGELIARLTAALRSKRLHDRLRQDNDHLRELAPVDSLTGTLDIRGLQQCISDLGERSRQTGSPIGAVLLDIDRLGQVNEDHGWDGGDKVLRAIAERTSRCLDADQVVGRCGPDELLVLLPGAGEDEARRFADRLRYTVSDAPHELATGTIEVDVRVGHGSVTGGDTTGLLAQVQQSVIDQKRATTADMADVPLVEDAPEPVTQAPPPPPPPPPPADALPATEPPPAPAPAEPAPADNSHLLAKIRQQMNS